ncbi:hypothetical protein SAMN04489859_109010 [Paracoccus alcaliphilus]
MVAQW